MKKNIYLLTGALCLFLVICYIFLSGTSNPGNDTGRGIQTEKIISDDVSVGKTLGKTFFSRTLPHETLLSQILTDKPLSGEDTESMDNTEFEDDTEFFDSEVPSYVRAYTEFLLSENTDPADYEEDFPIRGYYLFDVNFDNIPELGILHDSWGSMGGYFTLYCFDENKITAVSYDNGKPLRFSNYTQVLADFEQKKCYLLKEMYLLQGNGNGTYGYMREIKNDGQVPYVYNILNLEVDAESDLMSHFGTHYDDEDGFLSDPELDDCLITQHYIGNQWIDISSKEYLKQKRALIPAENSFVDLRNLDLNYLGANYDEDGTLLYTDVRMEKNEIDKLFRRFMQSLQ